jgi:hypothetical protein
MFKREAEVESLTCPDCGTKLAHERDLLVCKDHGAFFVYGPQLVVRAPRPAARPAEPAMPWENHRARVA